MSGICAYNHLLMNKIKKAMILLMLSSVSYGISLIILYMLFDMLYPPVTEDGHRYMPISNVIKSVVLAMPVTVAMIMSVRKYLK